MEQISLFRCKTCERLFEDEQVGSEHEGSCIPLEVDQRVRFYFMLVIFEGRITRLSPPVALGEEAIVYIETDEEVVDPDWSKGHDGKHVWVVRSSVIEVLPGD